MRLRRSSNWRYYEYLDDHLLCSPCDIWLLTTSLVSFLERRFLCVCLCCYNALLTIHVSVCSYLTVFEQSQITKDISHHFNTYEYGAASLKIKFWKRLKTLKNDQKWSFWDPKRSFLNISFFSLQHPSYETSRAKVKISTWTRLINIY